MRFWGEAKAWTHEILGGGWGQRAHEILGGGRGRELTRFWGRPEAGDSADLGGGPRRRAHESGAAPWNVTICAGSLLHKGPITHLQF
jgi:hypothetical protein